MTGPATQNYTNGGGTNWRRAGSDDLVRKLWRQPEHLDQRDGGSSGGNLIVIMLDTRINGGFLDSEIDDTSDGGRRAVSSPALNGTLNHPTGMNTYLPGANGRRCRYGCQRKCGGKE